MKQEKLKRADFTGMCIIYKFKWVYWFGASRISGCYVNVYGFSGAYTEIVIRGGAQVLR